MRIGVWLLSWCWARSRLCGLSISCNAFGLAAISYHVLLFGYGHPIVTFHTTCTSYQRHHLSRYDLKVDFMPYFIQLLSEDAIQEAETLICILFNMTFRSPIVG